MGLPGVKVGPLDPDVTSEFGQVSAHSSARQMIRLHRQLFPAELIQALVKKRDDARTKGLDLDEVRKYVSGLRLENGDPVVPEGAHVEAATVHGEQDRPQVLGFTYTLSSGRVGKWHAPYTEEALPESYANGSELSRVKDMKDRGIVSWDDQGHATEMLRREAAELRRQNEALRANLEAAAAGQDGEELPEKVQGDTRSAVEIVDANEKLGTENGELRKRVAELEQLTAGPMSGLVTATTPAPPRDTVASADEPVEGYDELKAHDAIKLIRSDDTDSATVQRILDYESTHANRGTVAAAAHAALGSGDND